MLIGIASVFPYGSTPKKRYQVPKERFPIAIGVADQDSGKFHTILISPPTSWGLFWQETRQEEKNRERQRKKKRIQVLAHITDIDLLKYGKTPKEAAEIVLELTKGHAVYSLNRNHDLTMLDKLSSGAAANINLLSTMSLANELTSPEIVRSLELQTKMSMGLYPRNKADIRWVARWIKLCQTNGK